MNKKKNSKLRFAISLILAPVTAFIISITVTTVYLLNDTDNPKNKNINDNFLEKLQKCEESIKISANALNEYQVELPLIKSDYENIKSRFSLPELNAFEYLWDFNVVSFESKYGLLILSHYEDFYLVYVPQKDTQKWLDFYDRAMQEGAGQYIYTIYEEHTDNCYIYTEKFNPGILPILYVFILTFFTSLITIFILIIIVFKFSKSRKNKK